MAITITCIIIILIYLLATLAGAVSLSPMQLILVSTPLLIISIYSLNDDWNVAALFSKLVLCFMSGYFIVNFYISNVGARRELVQSSAPTAAGTIEKRSRYRADTGSLAVVCLLTLAFTVYHFSKVGVPIFSGDVEASRYNLGGSGLFGLPSRTYLFGVPLLLAYSVANARVAGRSVWRDRWVRASWLLFFATRFISGFKSGLLEVLFVTLLVWAISSGSVLIPRYIGRILIAAALAVAAFVAVAAQYSSYQSNGRGLYGNINQRVTEGSAQAPVLVLTSTPSDLGDPRSAIGMDIDYFRSRYFHLGSVTNYGFTRLVSATISGGSPNTSDFLPPVTISIYAAWFYDFHSFAYLLLLLLGGFYRAVVSWARRAATTSPLRFAILFGVTRGIMQLVGNGETVYATLNWAFAIVVFSAIVFLSRLLRNGRQTQDNLPVPGQIELVR